MTFDVFLSRMTGLRSKENISLVSSDSFSPQHPSQLLALYRVTKKSTTWSQKYDPFMATAADQALSLGRRFLLYGCWFVLVTNY